jgi:hypothetical protein
MKSEGEIIEHLRGLKDLFNEKFETNDKAHVDILYQQKKTNGTILDHENRVKKLENWRWLLIGGWSASLIIIPLMMKFLSK